MAPEKRVSPAIRILRGGRDVSARATHLEAATRKFLVTTNERKQMSTTTNIKRLALIVVAALGLGLFTSIPAQAAINGTPTLTIAAGTASDGASDSRTAGTVTIAYLTDTTDTLTLTANLSAKPAAAGSPVGLFAFQDTSTTINIPTSSIIQPTGTDSATSVLLTSASGGGWVRATYKFFMDSSTARSAGTYTYTITATPYPAGVRESAKTVTANLDITVAALAANSLTASSADSTAFIGTATAASSDVVLSALATASDTPVGYLTVILKNAAGTTAARESVTVTTTIGTVGDGNVRGRSVVLRYNSTSANYNIYPDGTAGTGTITISTPSVTFPAKTISFYSAAAKTLTATVAHPILKVGTNAGAVRVTGVDAGGVAWAGTAYIYASSAADAVIAGSVTPTACSWSPSNQRHDCPVTGNASGTAKMKVIDASTVAAATATSNEISVVVNTAAVAKVAISFDKATYAPNERMRIYVTPQDSAGKPLPANTYTNLFAAGGITANAGFSGSSDTTSAVTIITAAADSSSTGAKAGSAVYTVYAPAAGGTVTISATGGSSLPVASQVAVTASATVTDSGAAALAAVNALATTVASLKTLITTLTNLVLKIQKKVKA